MSQPQRKAMPARLPATDAAVSRRALIRAGAACGAVAMLPACSEVTPAPRTIKWGRDLCEYCHMVFGDRRYAAEIWDAEHNRARLYDDFGCAVLAAYDLKIPDSSDIPFWVSDEARPEVWLEARGAKYRASVSTPMDYGHAAGSTDAYPLTYKAAATAIRDKAGCEHRG